MGARRSQRLPASVRETNERAAVHPTRFRVESTDSVDSLEQPRPDLFYGSAMFSRPRPMQFDQSVDGRCNYVAPLDLFPRMGLGVIALRFGKVPIYRRKVCEKKRMSLPAMVTGHGERGQTDVANLSGTVIAREAEGEIQQHPWLHPAPILPAVHRANRLPKCAAVCQRIPCVAPRNRIAFDCRAKSPDHVTEQPSAFVVPD
jgi:hypothetical protein